MLFEKRAIGDAQIELPKGYKATVQWVPHIGDIVPNFKARTTRGPIGFHEWAEGSWVYLFSHPGAFTPVCTTEMASFANATDEFAQRGVKLIALSRDAVAQQLNWCDDIERMFKVSVPFPVIEDCSGELASLFGMIHPKQSTEWTIRKSLIIDPSLRLRMIFEYPIYIGRSTTETLRVIDALQTLDRHEVGTPADWHPGNSVLLPHGMTDETANAAYGKRWRKLAEYLKVLDIGKQ